MRRGSRLFAGLWEFSPEPTILVALGHRRMPAPASSPYVLFGLIEVYEPKVCFDNDVCTHKIAVFNAILTLKLIWIVK